MAPIATAYGALLLVIALFDAAWLGLVAKDFYQRSLGPLLAERVNGGAAAAFYLLYALGLAAMAVRPALDGGGWREAALRGAGLGLFAYMTYDLSNLATLKGVPPLFALVDILWGGVLSAIAAGIAAYVALRIFG